MKVLICDAGQVGSTIAAYLAEEKNSVTVIDQDAAVVSRLCDAMDVVGVVGHAAHPDS